MQYLELRAYFLGTKSLGSLKNDGFLLTTPSSFIRVSSLLLVSVKLCAFTMGSFLQFVLALGGYVCYNAVVKVPGRGVEVCETWKVTKAVSDYVYSIV